jgi:hypothetical protein
MVVEQSKTPAVPYFASAKIASFKMVGSKEDAGKAVLQMYIVSGRRLFCRSSDLKYICRMISEVVVRFGEEQGEEY